MTPPSIPTSMRLRDFIPASEIEPLENWEYLGELWIGEAVGFTAVLQPEHTPDRTRAVSIDLFNLDQTAATRMLERIGLAQLRHGLTPADADLPPPVETERFVEDRLNHAYRWPGSRVELDCTFHHQDSLIFVSLYDSTNRIESDE